MDGMGILWLLLFTFSYLSHVSAGKHEKMVQSAMLVGSVYCDTCFHQEFSETSYFISGASVAIQCQEEGVYPSFQKEVKTNKHGEFKVQLPFRVGKEEKIIKRCMVKLVSSSKPSCAVASRATSSSFHLKSRNHGIHVFSAGFFTFKPIDQPKLCYQEASSASTSKFGFMKNNIPDGSYPPPANKNRAQKLTSTEVSKPSQSQPGSFFFPPIFPTPPPFGLPLPPNPFQPPPLLPPLPFVPSPPPFINIPPLPFFTPPPPPPFFNLPPFPPLPPLPSIPPLPLPFLTPPPPPPSFPFLPFPPIRFPPLPPIFPGIPPASPSKNAFP